MKDKIPTWILVWSVLMFLLPFGFGIVGYLNPAYFGPEWAQADAMQYVGPFGLYVGRNMASAVIMMLALSQRSAAMLIVALTMRMVSDIFDVIHNAAAGTLNLSFSLPAVILIIGCAIAIKVLWPIYRASTGASLT
jgi:hypothetical protein